MNNANSLLKRINTLLAHIEQQYEEVPDISDRIQAWAQEGLQRKFAVFQIPGLTSEQRATLCSAISMDIESRKTAAERKAEQRYHAKYPATGARERLLQKIEQIARMREDVA